MNWKETLLWPLTLPYGGVTHLRARAYRTGILRQRRLDGVVISVGNLTVGGTGKTPMVLWIAERLIAEGKRAAILSRGYRGKPASGDTAKDSSASGSDEVRLMQARLGDRVAFGVGANRLSRGRALSKEGFGWFVLDDGFQHLQLVRDVDIVLIDAMKPFGGGHLLPAGRLREGRAALGRADIIVITRSLYAPAVEAALRRDSDAPVFYARPQLESIREVSGQYPGAAIDSPQSRKFFAFCGIGNPASFLESLRDWKLAVAGHRFFPDHHRYTRDEVDSIQEEAASAGADALICTEKDRFNLSGLAWRLRAPAYCRISLTIDRAEEFWRTVMAKTESSRRDRENG
ncbi:MAG: tetraacyldisaccharide 4'-kinase [Candidatus Acidiferrales bacterium]